MPFAFRLASDWNPDVASPGRLTLTLTNLGDTPVSGFTLALTSLFRIKPDAPLSGGRLIEQVSNYHLLAPEEGLVLAPGESWSVSADAISHTLRHYTYGPKSAAVTLSEGTRIAPEITHTTLRGAPGLPRIVHPPRTPLPEGEAPISVIPHPARVAIEGQVTPPAGLTLGHAPDAGHKAFETVSALAERLFPGETIFATGGLPVEITEDTDQPEEGYALSFGDTVTLSARDKAGMRYGLITLAQILRGARAHQDDFVFPVAGTISDAPRFGWRGSHLDVARQVYTIAELERFLDTLAWNKLNRFHIHLNDDEGWRLDVPAYPPLRETAAYRGPDEAVPPLLGSPFSRHGICYSAADLKELVGHASRLGIETIPEIDMPGHCYCVLKALPQLRDPEESGMYRSVQYFPNNALNPALEATYTFLDEVVKTLVSIFPAPWIHIGGDEVAEQAWTGSPLARNCDAPAEWPGTFALQSRFLKRIQDMVRAYGKQTGAWEEAALGGGVDPEGSYLVAWKSSESGRNLAIEGYQVVFAPAERCYFDMAQSQDWWEPGASWAGTVTLEDTYAFDPGHDWPDHVKSNLIGVQSCLWCENLADRKLFNHLIYPRLSALAETGWSPRESKNFARFLAIQTLMPEAGLGR